MFGQVREKKVDLYSLFLMLCIILFFWHIKSIALSLEGWEKIVWEDFSPKVNKVKNMLGFFGISWASLL